VIRRILPLLAALFLMTGSAFAAEQHAEIQFVIHQGDSETAVTADLLLREKEIVVLSGLFPSYALSLPCDGAAAAAADDAASYGPFYLPGIGTVLPGIVQVQNPETSEGIFTGDLFDEAYTLSKGECGIYDLLTIPEKLGGEAAGSFLQNGISAFFGQTDPESIRIRYAMYDNGNYLTLTFLQGENTVGTASFDFSDPKGLKALIGNAENGTNYYWTLEVRVQTTEEMTITASLFSDPRKAGYRSVMRNRPVVAENWKLRLSEDRKEIRFTGEVLPGNGKTPIDISGSFGKENKPMLQMNIGFRDWDKATMTLNAQLSETTVNTEGLKTIQLENTEGLAADSGLSTEITVKMLPPQAVLMQAVPAEYAGDLLRLN
jgi:hypothetical protein